MPQSLARIWLHITFSTEGRRAYLQNPEIRDEMFRMLSHETNQLSCPAVRSGGWIDHVHILCGLSRTITVAKLVEHLKTETSKWIKKRTPTLELFHWQAGYGVFSVSQSALEQVIEYIERQEEHHRRLTYQEEFRLICRKHEIEIDERYVWD
jgi:putative transposase